MGVHFLHMGAIFLHTRVIGINKYNNQIERNPFKMKMIAKASSEWGGVLALAARNIMY